MMAQDVCCGNKSKNPAKEVSIGIAVDSTAVDDALEKVDALGDAMSDLAPMLSIRNCRNCTFNIYPSKTSWVES